MLSEEAEDQVGEQHIGFGVGVGGDDLDQRDGQEDGDRVVGAGFDLERRAHALAQIDVAGAQQEEHRRGVGRGDGGAEQEGFQPAEVEQIVGGGAEQRRWSAATPTVASDSAGPAACRKRVERRAEAGIEQDDGERQ